jgi:putative ABC transport system permease protein
MRSIWQDIRIGLRMLAKAPGISIAAIFAFGLGIASATAMISLAQTYLVNPISFPDVDRIVMVLNRAPGQTEFWAEVSPADFLDWRAQNHSFESLAAYTPVDVNLTGAGDPVRAQAYRVSANLFDTLRAAPRLGRGFVRGEDEPGREREAVLSAGLWRRQFASDPNIVGRVIRLNGIPTQIVGVMKDNVRFPLNAELWIPLALSPDEKAVRNAHYLSPLGRLNHGVSLEQAKAEMQTIQQRLQTAFPDTEKGWSVVSMTIGEYVAGPGRDYTIMCLWSVGFVLLIACTNVANLLLARGSARQTEFSIRTALGASRARLARQVLIESVLLSLGGSLVGLVLGAWWVSLIRAAMPPEVEKYIPGWDQIRLNLNVFLWTFGLAVAAGIIAGLFPAFFTKSAGLNENLKESGRGGSASSPRMRLRSAFVVVQIALSLVLLVGATLMARGVQTLFDLNFKFDPQSVLAFRVALPASRYATPQQRAAFFSDLVDRFSANTAVQTAAVATQTPGTFGDTETFSMEGQPLQPGEFHSADLASITPAYFKLLHLSALDGREFNDQDSSSSASVAIISERLAKKYWPGRSALGHRVKAGDEKSKEPWAIVVGVVPEVTYNPWTHDPPPTIYFPFRQRPTDNSYVAIRTTTNPKALIPLVRAAVAGIDPDQPVYDVFTLDRMISMQILGLSYMAALMGVLGLIALVLSAVGISGVMAYSVTQRTHEIGVRMALGATPRKVLYMFVFHGAKLTLIGFFIGLPMAIGLARLLSSLLFGVHSNDFTSFFGGALVLTVVVSLACYLPARQATRVDPMVALRYE